MAKEILWCVCEKVTKPASPRKSRMGRNCYCNIEEKWVHYENLRVAADPESIKELKERYF